MRNSAHLEPIRTGELLRGCAGKWVAMRNGEVVEGRETFDQLVIALQERDIKNVTVMRVPAEHEVELVGLG
jgi:hypothetical protein